MFCLDSVINSRELGGYRLPGGSVVKEGLLLRGGALARISEEDITVLKDRYHLAKVFDFRTKIELQYAPDKEIPGAQNIWMPAFDENAMEMKKMSLPHQAYRNLGEWLVQNAREPAIQEIARNMYSEMVTNEFTQIQYAGFFQNILATTEGAVYWHCSQGKDRTGLGAALILGALGADRELIMTDFAISNKCYAKELEAFLPRVNTAAEKAVIQTFIGVNCDYFSAALDLIDSTWGSLEAYLTGPLCLSPEDISALRSRYLQ